MQFPFKYDVRSLCAFKKIFTTSNSLSLQQKHSANIHQSLQSRLFVKNVNFLNIAYFQENQSLTLSTQTGCSTCQISKVYVKGFLLETDLKISFFSHNKEQSTRNTDQNAMKLQHICGIMLQRIFSFFMTCKIMNSCDDI